MDGPRQVQQSFARRVAVAASLAVFIVLFVLLVVQAAHVLLLLFFGILLAVFLNGVSAPIQRRTRLPRIFALFLVILVLLVILALSFWLLVPRVAEQIEVMSEALPQALAHLKAKIASYSYGEKILAQIPGTAQLMDSIGQIAIRTLGIFATTVGTLTSVAIVMFVGLYLAFDPQVYLRGILHLVAPGKRKRAEEVLYTMGDTLTHWLLGRLFAMAFVGVSVAVSLWFLEIRLVLILSIIAGLLDFVPFIGPVVAAVPVVLLALPEGLTKVFWVVVFYGMIQFVEGFVFTPLVQQREVAVPPVLILTSQIVLGLFLGLLGVVLATPLVAVTIVLVRMLYVEDVLEKPSVEPGTRK